MVFAGKGSKLRSQLFKKSAPGTQETINPIAQVNLWPDPSRARDLWCIGFQCGSIAFGPLIYFLEVRV